MTSTLPPVFAAIELGVFRSKYGSTMMILTFCAFIALITSSVCCGVGGMPGFGSMYAMTSMPNASQKFGHERWYVTTFNPLYGAICAFQRLMASVRRRS